MKKILIASGSAIVLFVTSVTVSSLIFEPNPAIRKIEEHETLNQVVIDTELLAKVNEHIIAAMAPEEETTEPRKLTKIEKFRDKISNTAIADLSESDSDALTIFKKADKKSKIKGYLADGATMTILEQNKDWTHIKSDKIEGYVRTKYVVSDKTVEDTIIDNRFVSATITKDSVCILSKNKKNSSAVGMGYKGKDYPVLGFSDDDKYAYIERTETISGWIPLSDIKLNITAPQAMTKDEFDDYQYELELEEQKALNSYLNMKIGSTGNKLQDAIINLVSHNESGNYKAARNSITSGEKTITVGAWQWYGENAHNILRLICSANTKKAKEIIEDAFTGNKAEEKANALYKDIMGRDNWEKSEREFKKNELIAIKELLGSDQGVKIQNSKIQSDIQAKMRVATSSYKLNNDAIVAYFCDLFWQSPSNAREIIDKCIDHYGNAKKFCKDEDGLAYLHKVAMKHSVMKKYSRRRRYTYAFCKKLQ
jgi:hypothetical protein